MKTFRLFLLILLLPFFGCSDDDSNIDKLEEIGILGKWEITNEEINGISDLLPKCCRFFEFFPDQTEDDFSGIFTYRDFVVDRNSGTFIIDPSNNLIVLEHGQNEQVVHRYELDKDRSYLTINFMENNYNFEQGWVRQD